jgi:hypothetical protein
MPRKRRKRWIDTCVPLPEEGLFANIYKDNTVPRYIVKLTDKKTNIDYYLLWSTVVDAPVTDGVSREQFEEVYREEYGRQGMTEFVARMARVDKKGTSSMIDESAESLISFNRAGPDESLLSYDEVVRFYCLGEKPDEGHPCWKQRHDEFNRRSEANGGLSYDDEKEVFAMFPYPESF